MSDDTEIWLLHIHLKMLASLVVIFSLTMSRQSGMAWLRTSFGLVAETQGCIVLTVPGDGENEQTNLESEVCLLARNTA